MRVRHLKKGITHGLDFNYEQPLVEYRPIQAISNTAPVSIQCTDHGLPPNWRFAVTGVKGGGSQLNAKTRNITDSIKPKYYYPAFVVDDDNVQINNIDASTWSAYISGGMIRYNKPFDFTGCNARMHIREAIDSRDFLLELTNGDGIVFGVGSMAITIPDDFSDGLRFSESYFDAEIYFPDGSTMIAIPTQKIIWDSEVTHD